MRRAGVEPALPEAGGLQPPGHAHAQPTHDVRSIDAGGSRTHNTRRFELRRFSGLRTAPASPGGFEPPISTVTGWRALLAALRGRSDPGWTRTIVARMWAGHRCRWTTGSQKWRAERAEWRVNTMYAVTRTLLSQLSSLSGLTGNRTRPVLSERGPACEAGVFLLDHEACWVEA